MANETGSGKDFGLPEGFPASRAEAVVKPRSIASIRWTGAPRAGYPACPKR
jgi:hypothetical protein